MVDTINLFLQVSMVCSAKKKTSLSTTIRRGSIMQVTADASIGSSEMRAAKMSFCFRPSTKHKVNIPPHENNEVPRRVEPCLPTFQL